MKKILFSLVLISLLLLNFVSAALDYDVQVDSPSHIDVYEGEISANDFSATITNNGGVCHITCGWTTTADSDSGIDIASETISDPFKFKVKTEGNYRLIITCDRIEKWNCWSDPDSRTYPLGGGSYQFTYLHNGDDICTTPNEDCYSNSNDCICEADKKCKEDMTRNEDSIGCTTYCGNNKVESQYEDCSNCPSDVGKCNGITCLSGSECEGGYCVHEECYDKPYKQGDGFCDSGDNENCKSSPLDCSCGGNERCGSSGICETYCGNEVCEESEMGICKSDCTWCGDGECSNNENCGSCENDCGICESSELNEQIANQTQEVVKQSLESISKKQKQIGFYSIGAIIIFVLVYLGFKFGLSKKQQKKIIKDVEEKLESDNSKKKK